MAEQPQPSHQDAIIATEAPPPTTTTDPGSSSSSPCLAVAAAQNSTSSKIPFRPRKIRKLSDESTPENPDVKPQKTNTKPTTKNSKAMVRHPQQPRIIARTLSCEGEISIALRYLRSADPVLARVIDVHQPPTFDSFNPPFLALTKSILYQQLALKAGSSIYTRFVSLCGGESGVVPEAVLALNQQQLRQIGVSSRKASYLHDLANKYHNGILSDSSIVDMDDKSLFTMLTMVKGIGSWSVHMFMIFSLHRPDVLPIGDLGIRKGVQLLYGLEQLPRPSQMDQLCEKWRPYRSVASWYMWRFAESKVPPATTMTTTMEAVTLTSQQLQQQQQHQQQQFQHQHQQLQHQYPHHQQHQLQQQQQQQQPLQLIDPITSIANLGACAWGP